MEERLPEISRTFISSSREGSPSKSRIDNAIVELARELQQTQKISENSLHEVHREIERIVDHRHKTDRSIERLTNRMEALELRCENRVRSLEDSIDRIVARLETSMEKVVYQIRSRSADESTRIQSWLSSTVATFTSQISDCRDRQERDRVVFAEELLGLQETTNERYRALRSIVERQGEAQIAFEKGFRMFLARYQGEIEDVLLTLQENTAEKYRLVETRIDVQNGELQQLTSSLEAHIEAVSKQNRRRGEALQNELSSGLESLKESMLTRTDIGRIMEWVRQDLVAVISDRKFAESVESILHESEPNDDQRLQEDSQLFYPEPSEMKSSPLENQVQDGNDSYNDGTYEDSDLDESLSNPVDGNDNPNHENAQTIESYVKFELQHSREPLKDNAEISLITDEELLAVQSPNNNHPMTSSTLQTSSSDAKSDYESSFEDDHDVECPPPLQDISGTGLLPDQHRNNGDIMNDVVPKSVYDLTGDDVALNESIRRSSRASR